MNRILCIFSMLVTTTVMGGVKAQELHFIYLQSEQKQAFYIRAEGKVYSSSDAGFVILPQLKEGIFNFTLGFPKNKWAAQNFQLEITNRDIGFQLKKVDENNWALYDMQTNELLSALAQPTSNAPYVTLINDEFTNVLAEVSNTPSIKEKKWEVPAADKAATAITATPLNTENISTQHHPVLDTPTAVVTVPNQAISQVDTIPSVVTAAMVVDPPPAVVDSIPVVVAPEISTGIEKVFDQKSDSGRMMKYMVQGVDGMEEVIVLLPNEDPSIADQVVATPIIAPPVQQIEMPVVTVASDTAKIEQAVVMPISSVESVKDTVAIKAPLVDSLAQRDEPIVKEEKKCVDAEEKDLIVLRRKMVGEDNEEKMLEVATDNMKQHCYNTDQIGHLANLFLEEAKRCVFLEKAFQSCSNRAEYGKLRNLLTSSPYQDRFNQLLQ